MMLDRITLALLVAATVANTALSVVTAWKVRYLYEHWTTVTECAETKP